MFRPLTGQDLPEIGRVLESRGAQPLPGVNWTAHSVSNELKRSKTWGYFENGLQALVLYQDIGVVLDILLIFSRKGAPQAAHKVLHSLINAQSCAEELWLEVHEDNKNAIRFYESEGFARVSRRYNYYPDGKSAYNYTLRLKK